MPAEWAIARADTTLGQLDKVRLAGKLESDDLLHRHDSNGAILALQFSTFVRQRQADRLNSISSGSS